MSANNALQKKRHVATGQQEIWVKIIFQNKLYSSHRSQNNSKQQCIKKTQTTKFPDYNTQKLDAARQIQEFLLSREQPGDFWE